ncbi:ubiquitin-associated protein 2a isoform X2 [Esox lucius]|uniref:ubiquitin-associated protein 2a isoform X2 n=1 Tax=Esox lucius TaxID=8010 RepID=UPI001476A1E3|nr:ubiquitin-associated protein 2a isoform X2 [Esox lucius]
MMTSLGGDKARGTRDKALPVATHTTQPQKQLQATAEQIRLAQMIYDKNDADFEDKVNQLMEVTGKNQDECMVALHDCNEDVNRAINFLLESTSDTTSWETVGKKKPPAKDGPAEGKENKENREKRGGEREGSRGRGGSNRRGRGASNRSRQGERGRGPPNIILSSARPEENGVDVGPGSVDRGSERGRRGGRGGRGECHLVALSHMFQSTSPVGSGGRGRGRVPAGSRFTAQGMGIFNPADYTPEQGTGTTQSDAWDSGANNSTDGTVAWRSTLDDWAAEDWSEDLSETKVFTASSAPAPQNHVTPGQSLDLTSLLQKPVGGSRGGGEAPSSQSLVFTNSHHHPARNGSAVGTGSASYAHAALSSVLGSGFGDLGQPKRSQSSPGAQILEQLKGPGLGPLPSSQAAPPPSTQGGGGTTLGGRLPGLGGAPAVLPPPSTSSWDVKVPEPSAATTSSLTSHFSREFKLQPEPSLVLSQLVQRHGAPSLPLARQPSPPPAQPPSPNQGPTLAAIGAKPAPSSGPDPQGDGPLQQHRVPQLKAPKRRIPPTSKIPSSAVEMPGSADVPGLNVQFGALDFGSEAALPDFGPAETCVTEASRESAPAPQSQTSLYSKPLSESMGTPLSIPLPLSSSEPVYPSPLVAMPSLAPSSMGTVSSSAPCSSSSVSSSVPSSASPFVSVGSGYDCGPVAPHPRLAFPQSKEAPGPIMNGLNGVRTSGMDTSSASSTPKPESPSLSISTSSAPAPSTHMPSLPPHSSALPSMPHDMPSASLATLSSHGSSSHSSALGSSSLTYTSVDSSVSSLAPSSGSYPPGPAQSLHQVNSSAAHIMATVSHMNSVVSSMAGTGALHAGQALGLGGNGTAAQSNLSSAPRTAPLLSSSTGKAPPNLSQGVPPLLPNQYIMGPGGLLPAYPIYGYEDLHMLQSRLPMPSLQDYYGITFPGPTALSGRDGSLTNNHYSGEVTKFGRGDSTSPAPPSSLSSQQQPPQAQGPSQSQPPQPPQPQGHHGSQQQAFLPPGYSYTGLPYYPGMPGAAFQYGHTMFMPQGQGPAKQHGVGLGNPSASPFQQQQASGYGQHAFSSGYEDLTQGQAGVDYSKGYSNSSQSQAKSAATGPSKGGISVTSGNSGVPEISGSVYNKTQSFDKQGFHAGTPPPFNLPSALGGPGGAPGGYAPTPFLHILQPAHQQPHNQMLHHHLPQDGQGGPSLRGQSSNMQKSQVNKSSYGSSPYWGN